MSGLHQLVHSNEGVDAEIDSGHSSVGSILKGYIKRDIGLLAGLVSHAPDGVEDGVEAGFLVRSFDQPLDKYSTSALEYCLTQECSINGIGAAMEIRRALYDYWNSIDYGHYCGPHQYDEACGSVSGCPAHALAITTPLKAIKIKSNTRGPRNGVKAIIDIQAMAQAIVWSERQYPLTTLFSDEERYCALLHAEARALFALAFSLLARQVPLRNKLTALRVRDVDRDWMEGLANGGYVLFALSDDRQIDAPKHLGNWLRYRELITGQTLEPDAYLFPHLPSSGPLHSDCRMTQGQLQRVIERFAFQAGCTPNSFRRGGIQYHSPGRWSISTIRELGRWAALNAVELKEDRLDISVPLRAKL
ncbi:hypothetical protein DXG01_005912 [Tephrocybe rancida]|nr:hypothetical protein DXG01_005912 [Tephrocybe rancida]